MARFYLSYGIILALFVILANVKADTPLQTVQESLFSKHSHVGRDAEAGISEFSTKARLPKNVLPLHYELKLLPILDEIVMNEEVFTAPGTVQIIINAVEPTNVITLHADATLEIRGGINVTTSDGTESFDVTYTNDTANQFLILNLVGDLLPGTNYTISIEFVAPIAIPPVLNGLYRSSYIKPDGQISYIATTQFEAIAARQLFPCFDEPWIKATFRTTIGYNATKNIALSNEDPDPDVVPEPIDPDAYPGWVYQTYLETVKMPTYLIALVVGEYACFDKENRTIYDKPVRTCGPTHLINEQNGGVYAAEKAAEILRFFEDHYDVKYNLSKMDSVAIPDFTFGAMENWGLNIYREPYLLYYDGISTEVERNRITIILAHELAHQWFGNLVTTQFWDQIYLNEGFATYNEYIATDNVAPQFESLKIQVQDAVQAAMAFDATAATHPIINSANGDHNNDQLMGYFDRITYEKGGSVIRMMEGFLGKEVLKTGLTAYLNAMQYQGAHQEDLFREINEVADTAGVLPTDRTIKDIMDTWTLQSGFPLVRVDKASDSRIFISQSRFSNFVDLAQPNELNPNDLWEIPVAIASADEPNFSNHTPKLWIPKNVALRSYEIDTTKWLVVNPEAIGYFRVLYDQSLLQLILQQFSTDLNVISPMSRSQLTDDYFASASANYVSIETALEFTKQLDKETELVVWNTVFSHLRGVFNRLSGATAGFAELRQYLNPKLNGSLHAIGLKQLPEHKGANVLLRTQLLDWACALDQQDCLDYALELFELWDADEAGNHSAVPIDIQQVMYCAAIGVFEGAEGRFESMKARYLMNDTMNTARQRQLYLNALGCSADPTLLASLQDEILPVDSILKTVADKRIILQKLAANSHSREALISFLGLNGPALIAAVSDSGISSTIQTLSTYVGEQSQIERIEDFVNANSAGLDEVRTQIDSYLRTMANNLAWRQTYEVRLRDWFRASK